MWPAGCEKFEDVPADMILAISHAYRILSWQESFVEDEMPPQWMWPHSDDIEAWFDEVMRRRKDGLPSDNSDSTMVQNELAKGRGR